MTKILTRTILLVSFVSLFTDIASEMLYPIMPVYLRSIGFSVLLIGILEGVAEATAGLSKGYFGNLSDVLQKRVPLSKGAIHSARFPSPCWRYSLSRSGFSLREHLTGWGKVSVQVRVTRC